MAVMGSDRLAALVLTGAAVSLGAACGDGSGAAPSTSPSAVAADPTSVETFGAPLPVGGTVFYSFSIAQYGTVTVTLTGISGAELPESPTLAIGIGQPVGTTCNAPTVTTVAPADAPQLTGVWGPGVFCVKVTDSGSLVGPVRFTAAVAHP